MSTSTRIKESSDDHQSHGQAHRHLDPQRVVLVLLGLTALAVLLQAVWAGIFLEHDGGRDAASSWIDVHARGGEIAIVLASLATVVAVVNCVRARSVDR